MLCVKFMNREIEFHDSTLKKIKIDGETTTICFDKAYVNHSEGTPGLDKGTGWEQTINIILCEASIEECPADLPNDIDTGYIMINGEKSINMIKLPSKIDGEIVLELFTMYGEKLRIKCKKLYTQELNNAQFVEDFPGYED